MCRMTFAATAALGTLVVSAVDRSTLLPLDRTGLLPLLVLGAPIDSSGSAELGTKAFGWQ